MRSSPSGTTRPARPACSRSDIASLRCSDRRHVGYGSPSLTTRSAPARRCAVPMRISSSAARCPSRSARSWCSAMRPSTSRRITASRSRRSSERRSTCGGRLNVRSARTASRLIRLRLALVSGSPPTQERQAVAARDLVESERLHRLDLGKMLRQVAVHARSRVVEDHVLSVAGVEAEQVVVEPPLRDLRGEEVARRNGRIGRDRPHRSEERLVARLAGEDRLPRRCAVRLTAQERVREVDRERQAAEGEREEQRAHDDAARRTPAPALAETGDPEDRCAKSERDERRAVLVVKRVKTAVVGQHQIAKRRDRRHECPLRAQRETETRSEEAQDEDDLRSDLALPKHSERTKRIEEQRPRDLALIAPEARVTAEVLIGSSLRERRDDELQRHDEGDDAAKDHDRARPPAPLKGECDTKTNADDRDLFLREERGEETQDHRDAPARREEVQREPEGQNGQRDLVEVVQRDERERRAQQIRRDPYESLPARRKEATREQIDRPHTERESDRLNDDQRLGTRNENVQRQDQQQRGREVVAEE